MCKWHIMFTLNARVLTFTLVGGGDVVALQLKKRLPRDHCVI